MKKNHLTQQRDLDYFNNQIATLQKGGMSLKEIANALDIHKLNKERVKVADLSVLNKLMKGEISSNRKITLKQFSNKLALKFHLPFNDVNSIPIENQTHAFILYYWSATQQVNIGVLIININSIKESKFYYIKRNEQNELRFNKEYELASFEYLNIPTIEISIKRPEVNTRTYFVAQKGSALLDDIKFLYFSYCGAMNHLHTNFAGIGILEQVKIQNLHNRLLDLETNGIPIQLYNSLYKRRLDLYESELKAIDELKNINEQKIMSIKNISGYWVGYSLHSKDILEKSNKLVKIVLFIDLNGLTTVYSMLNELIKYQADYSGIITLPHGTEVTVIEIQLQHYQHNQSKTLLLNYNHQILAGNINGWKNKNNSIFSKAIYFERINPKVSQNKLDFIFEQKPGIYDASQLNDYSLIVARLQQIEKQTMNIIE